MPRHLPPLALLPPLFALLSTGCASPPRIVEAPRLIVPASLLACADQPNPPAPFNDDAQLAGWIVDLAAAGDDCRERLAAVALVVAP